MNPKWGCGSASYYSCLTDTNYEKLSSGPNHTFFPQEEVVKSIGNPAGIGQGTGLGLRERERDGIGLGHYRLRANCSQKFSGEIQIIL